MQITIDVNSVFGHGVDHLIIIRPAESSPTSKHNGQAQLNTVFYQNQLIYLFQLKVCHIQLMLTSLRLIFAWYFPVDKLADKICGDKHL